MMLWRRSIKISVSAAIVVMIALLGSGCARSPDVRHFTLGTQFESEADQRAPDLAVLIGPIRLPSYLERPQIARRGPGGEVDLDEFNRWLGGFESTLTAALAAEVRRQLGSVRVVGYPSSAPFPIDYSVRIHVDEWIVDESNTLRVGLRWALVSQLEGESPLLSAHEAAIDLRDRSTEAVVEAHDRALTDFAGLITDELVAVHRGR